MNQAKLIQTRLLFLLRNYAHSGSPDLAEHIYRCLEQLLPYLDEVGFSEERCHYYRLLKHWRIKSACVPQQ